MPFGTKFDPDIHCRRCRGWGTVRNLGEITEHTCEVCHGSGAKVNSNVPAEKTVYRYNPDDDKLTLIS